MSQVVTFYTCNDDPFRVDKQPVAVGQGLTKEYNLTRNCSMLAPTLLTAYDSNVFSSNYCYVGTPFNKYYYITDISLVPGGKMEIICKIDPLKSHETQLISCIGTIIRAENPKNGRQLYDSKYPLLPKMEVSTQYWKDTPFSTADGWNYVLSVMGKEGAAHDPTS